MRAKLTHRSAALLLMLAAATVSADVLKFARFHLMAGKSPNSYELDVQLPFVLTASPSAGRRAARGLSAHFTECPDARGSNQRRAEVCL